MGLFRRIAGLLGFVKDDNHDLKDEEDNDNDNASASAQSRNRVHMQQNGLPRKGFSVPVQVAVDRSHKNGPIILPTDSGDGGVQGLGWYAKRLGMDDDGDVAEEFLEEVMAESLPGVENQKTIPNFEVKYSSRSVKVKNQVISFDGTIQQCVEHRGRLQWV